MTSRKARSFLSLFLVVVLVLSFGTSALAAEVTPSAEPVCTEEGCTHDHVELHEEDTHVCTEKCSHDEESTETSMDETTTNTDETASDIQSDEYTETSSSETMGSDDEPQTDETAQEEANDDSVFDWSFSGGVLVIDGHGTPETFTSAEDQPWAAVREQITEVYIDDCCGLNPENIAYWFADCTNLAYAELPASVQTIGYHAFYNCMSLDNLVLFHEAAPTIHAGAFVTNKPVPTETPHEDYRLHIDVMNIGVMDALCDYDWYADGSPVTISPPNVQLMTASADAPMMRAAAATRASGSCELCRVTCSYTVGYDQWTDTFHCVRHWCSNCGLDQYGGVVSENHTYSSNGYCSKCGYYNSAYDNSSPVCYHSSTKTSWSGCDWYEYCRSCGELVDYGTSHSYSYGAWSYYSSTRHSRTGTCTSCGTTTTAYGNHSTTNKYTSYSSTQHRYGKYCSLCGSYVGSTTYGNHSFSYGSWSSYNGTQHRRLKSCSTCGYSEYEYANHSLSYGSWINHGATEHKRTVSCSCGYSTTEYASHSLNRGDWESVSETQHERTVSCSCGYHSTETEAHSYTYGSWSSHSDSEHKRIGTCVCGDTATEYGNHTDADGNGSCDSCSYTMSRFSVTVPASLVITVSEDGRVYTASDATIINNSTAAVEVTGITVTAEGLWTIVPYDTNMADVKVNAKQIGLRINDAATQYVSTEEQLALGESWQIAKDASLPLVYDAVVSATTTPINEQVLTVVFVMDWAA